MTHHEAEEYNHLLINEVIKEAETLGIEGKAGGEFIDRNILVIPDDPRKGMIFLGEESASYKLGNVRLNIKSAIIAALELVASVNLPESFFNYLQLLIVTALFIQKATKQEIKQEDAYVLYFLHQRNCYEQGICESEVQQEYLHWCERTLDKYPDNLEWDKTIERLREEKTIDIENEKIYLKELVLGHIK